MLLIFFFFNDTATTEIYTLSLHDALPISPIFVFSKPMNRKVLTEQDVKRLLPGSPCYVEAGTILTPLAREIADDRQNTIIVCANGEELASLKAYNRRIALGADPTGWTLKEQLK